MSPCSWRRRRCERASWPCVRCGCDAIEPGGEPVGVAERAGLAGQDEEGGLEGVLGELVVAQELSADAQDHRAMAGNQRGEGGLVGRRGRRTARGAGGRRDPRANRPRRATRADGPVMPMPGVPW